MKPIAAELAEAIVSGSSVAAMSGPSGSTRNNVVMERERHFGHARPEDFGIDLCKTRRQFAQRRQPRLTRKSTHGCQAIH